MNTKGINIGKDCENLIIGYYYQLKYTEKYNKCMEEIKQIVYYCNKKNSMRLYKDIRAEYWINELFTGQINPLGYFNNKGKLGYIYIS